MTVTEPGAKASEQDQPEGDAHKLTATGGLAALSLDALSSVAYGPEAIVVVLAAAGAGAVRFTFPITIAIAALLMLLVVSYRQVIAVHPDGGGAYAVAKASLGRRLSLLAAGSLVVDYVLTVAVSLAAGAASLGSVYPVFARHLLPTCLAGLVVLTAINLVGIAESARLLMLPTLLFIVCVLATIAVGLVRSHPVAHIGTPVSLHATETLSVLLILKAFASGCSALTGVEAIANGVPAFRSPAVKRAQRTEVALGVLLGVMLIGLAVQIKLHHTVPRGGVTVLAQLTAGAFGTGWIFAVSNISVTLVLAFAANTSFGGLPVLMHLLADDNRLPHLFSLRAERPVYHYGVVTLALFAGALLIGVGAETNRLLPLFAIGVFIGFTISQSGLVQHWRTEQPPRWRRRAVLNGTGALLTALAAIVFFVSKFSSGAWLLIIIIPGLVLLFQRIERYYAYAGKALGIGELPVKPNLILADHNGSLVIVPVVSVTRLTELALSAASKLGGEVVPVAVDLDNTATTRLVESWTRWDCGLPLRILPSRTKSLVSPMVDFVDEQLKLGRQVTVLLSEVEPRRRRYQVLHNQRGLVLAANLRARTDAIVATLPYRL